MSEIALNIEDLHSRIAAAAIRVGRDPAEVTICAVSKTVPVERIREAIDAGVNNLGENYYQEAREKLDLLPKDIHWHFIGHLQTNKAKYVVGRFALIQSVDRIELATEIDRRAKSKEVVQRVLIEVKLDPAETKTGIAPENLAHLVEETLKLPNVELAGLMGIPPLGQAAELSRPYFANLRELYETLPAENRRIVSMGMTADFEVAIEEGANLIRIGTAIFGRRSPFKSN